MKEVIERLLESTQRMQQTNRRKAAYAYTPNAQERFRLAAEQNARDCEDYTDQLRRM